MPDRDAGVWDGISVSRIYYGGYFDTPMSVPAAYYPHTGYINGNGSLNSVNNITYLWNALDRYTFRVNTGVGLSDWVDQYNGMSVRCMRDAEFTISTLEEIVEIGDTHVILKGDLVVTDGTVMDAKGIVFSATTSDLKVGKEDCSFVNAENALPGEMSVMIDGLKPHTTYWYRAYARGAYNTRYGVVRSFKTKGAADNEGFGSEDFDWTE